MTIFYTPRFLRRSNKVRMSLRFAFRSRFKKKSGSDSLSASSRRISTACSRLESARRNQIFEIVQATFRDVRALCS